MARTIRRTQLTRSGVPVGIWRTQCSAHSKRSGLRCKRAAVPGIFVCSMHGGGGKIARAAGVRRLESLADTAIGEMMLLMGNRDPAVRMKAALSVIDRIGKPLNVVMDDLDREDEKREKQRSDRRFKRTSNAA